MQSDSQLVSDALRGERAAFAMLVGRYEQPARAIALHCLGNQHDAEDAAQEAFVAAFRKLSELRESSLFGRWLLTIVRHEAERIGKARRKNMPLEFADQIAEPENAKPDSQLDQDAELLLAAVMDLPERERRLLMLRHFGGHSVAEIAEIVGRPIGTVTKQISRGHARLRKRFAEVRT